MKQQIEITLDQKRAELETLRRSSPTFDMQFNREEIIQPQAFVWHVSYPGARKSIRESGILRNRQGAVFANNRSDEIHNFWPFPIDKYEWWFSRGFRGTFWQIVSSEYDFWRINTWAVGTKWRIDPWMRSDCDTYSCGKPQDFICTRTDIPTHAIELYKYNWRINELQPFAQWKNNPLHYSVRVAA